MASNARLIVVQTALAHGTGLTPHQALALKLWATPTASGNDRSVRGVCQGLRISRQSFYRTLRRAGINLRDLADCLEAGGLD